MFLASKLRAAASRGELDRIEIDPALPARKDEFIAHAGAHARRHGRVLQAKLRELAGKRVFVMGSYNLLYELATEGLARGVEARVRAGLGGGQRRRRQGHRAARPTGRSRCTSSSASTTSRRATACPRSARSTWRCERGPLPRAALGHPLRARPRHQRAAAADGRAGRAGRVLRPCTRAHWGGIISGDEIRSTGTRRARAAGTTVHIAHDIERYSEKQGGRPHHLRGDPAAPARGHRLPEGVRGMSARTPSRWSCGASWSRTTGSTFGGRGGAAEFRAPDPREPRRPAAAARRRWTWPTSTRSTFDDIVDFLEPSARRSTPRRNTHVQEALRGRARSATRYPASMLAEQLPCRSRLFARVFVREMVDAPVGIDHLEGWVEQKLVDGRAPRIRAFGVAGAPHRRRQQPGRRR